MEPKVAARVSIRKATMIATRQPRVLIVVVLEIEKGEDDDEDDDENEREEILPQRGCVMEPRVAARGSICKATMIATRQPWVCKVCQWSNPKGVAILLVASDLIRPRDVAPLVLAPFTRPLATLSPQTGEGVRKFDRSLNFVGSK